LANNSDHKNNKKIFCIFLATVVTTVTSGGPPLDFTVTGSHSYRPLTFTEKVFTDEWAKKVSTNNNPSKESIITNQQQGLYLNKISENRKN